MQIVQWKVNGLFHADAVKCKQEIESIGTDISPQEIVEFARNPDTDTSRHMTMNVSIVKI